MKELNIIFTGDTHSHITSYKTVKDEKMCKIGGYARVATYIKSKPNPLVLDCGDFSMGTLAQTVYATQASELRMLGAIGCDVTTIGNHEFDYRTKGLVSMLTSAMASGDRLPAITSCSPDYDASHSKGAKQLKEIFKKVGIKDYVIINKNGIKIAVLGVLGKDAIASAPTCELVLRDAIPAVKETVKKIKKNEKPDLIICLSHCGIWQGTKKDEDSPLAKEVPELDLIISGHSHREIVKPLVYGDTTIVGCGEYTRLVGDVTLTKKENGRWTLTDYKLVPMDANIEEDPKVKAKAEYFLAKVDEEYLSRFGYHASQVLAHNDITFTPHKDIERVHAEHNLGNIMSDAYRKISNDILHDVDIAMIPSGTIRNTILKGDVSVEDAFNLFPLGVGKDGVSGYPLIDLYFSGQDIMTAAEIDATFSDIMPTVRLYYSGVNMSFNPHRMLFDRAVNVTLDEGAEIEKGRLYHAVVDLFTAQMLGNVMKATKGFVKIRPKDENGKTIKDFESRIIYDEKGNELKAWVAIARYIESFGGEIPEYYATCHDRKVLVDDPSLSGRLKNSGKYIKKVFGKIGVLVVVVTFVVSVAIKIRRKFKNFK